MIKRALCNTLAKKLAVFAVTFFVIGGVSAITAFSPPSGVGAVLHRPPVDLSRAAAHLPDQLARHSLVAAATGIHASAIWGAAQEETEAVAAYARMPASLPLRPHTDPLGFFYLESVPLSYSLQEYIYDRSAQLGLEYELVLALIWRESTFRIEAVTLNRNGTRDSGLMQINDVNRGWLRDQHGIHNLLDPHQNIDAGTYMIADLLSRYGENYALMAYQYGEGGMLRMVERGADPAELTRQVRAKRDEFRALRAQIYNTL